MKALLQRVTKASVSVNNECVSSIKHGLLIFLGVEKGDTQNEANYLIRKIANLRIFEDDKGKMNLSIQDVKGEILLVSQFTLAGDTSKGNRPGFDNAAKPDIANDLYLYFCNQIKKENITVKCGIFQADMKVELINDGPVTFMLEKRNMEK